MKFKKIILAVSLVSAALTVSAAALQQEQAALSGKMIRLHVVANSDDERDQAVKLQVRDAVLAFTEPLLADSHDPETVLRQNLEQIQDCAMQCLRSNGFSDQVRVTLGKEYFPTRVYDSFALPAGVYTALRVTLGDGEGHNWWCVVFPSICLRAAGDMETVAASAGFTKEEIGLITEENGGYVLKFKIIEVLQQLQKYIFAKKEMS